MSCMYIIALIKMSATFVEKPLQKYKMGHKSKY